MKIFFTIKALNGIAGGAERVLCVVASELANRGHDVTILSFDHDTNSPFYQLSPYVKRQILGKHDPKHKSTLPEILSRILKMRKVIKKENPDIVVGFMHSIFVPLAISLIGTGIPVIASEHIVPQYYKCRRFEYAAMIISGLFAKKITVLSEPVRSLYPKILQKKMIVTPNPVSSFPSPTVTERKKILLNVARLDEQKDQKTLIEAFSLLSAKYPDWIMRIIGEGTLRSQLEQQIAKLGLKDRIFMPGKNPSVENEYAQAEIFVIPSLYESFGLATAEALSFKLPCVGFSDCPGTNEIIFNDINGILVAPETRVKSLAKALDKLMASEDYRRKLGNKGPETILQYQPEAIAIIWEKLLTQTL